MPLLPVFTSTPEIGNCINATLFNKSQPCNAESGCQADVETAIPVKKGRVVSIHHQILLVDDEHGDDSTIFTGILNLFDLILIRVKIDLGTDVNL